MDRLTDKHYTGNGYYMKCSGRLRCGGNCCECDQLDELVDRLGTYEDTGLTPEQAGQINESLAQIVQIIGDSSLDRLRELAQADKEGRLVVLPCKVGDVVYFIFDGKIHDVRVQGIPLGRNGELILNFGGYPVRYAWGSEVGKSVFLTREEAEKALKGGESGG